MIQDVRLPEISENVDTGDVIDILVQQGDYVEKDQPLVELETEKAAFEVPSPAQGKVVEVLIKQGDTVKVGQVLMKIDTEAKADEQKPSEPDQESDETSEDETKEEPSEGEKLPEPEPEEEPKEEKPRPEKPEQKQKTAPPEHKPQASKAVAAAPSVRQLARELGVDIHDVRGTGQTGRITADDVKAYARNLIAGRPESPVQRGAMLLPDFSKWGSIERKPMSTTRKKIAETLSHAWSSIPHVTQFAQADITGLEQSRKLYANTIEDRQARPTLTSIALKITAVVLKEFPVFNASLDPESNEIIYKHYVHISVAVETDRGLLVPVVRDADSKSLSELSLELNRLAEKARQHKIGPDDMVGGNFTISNLGGIGGTNFAPIIYWPQVAILGISHAVRKPITTDGGPESRLILPLSLSYDHRLIDGVQGLTFLRRIAEYLENPFLLAFD